MHLTAKQRDSIIAKWNCL